MRRVSMMCAALCLATGLAGCAGKPEMAHAERVEDEPGAEPLRGPWRVTKSLAGKSKNRDEDGNTYACMDKACKVSRKVDEKRD